MDNNSSTKCYHENKERLQKKKRVVQGIKIFLKKKQKKSSIW